MSFADFGRGKKTGLISNLPFYLFLGEIYVIGKTIVDEIFATVKYKCTLHSMVKLVEVPFAG